MNFKNLLTIAFLLSSLSTFAAEECGLKGSIEDRIRDCSYTQKEDFMLVTRIKARKHTFEVYKDLRTNLLWSDTNQPTDMNYRNAMNACEYYVHAEMGFIKDVNWELPTINMWKEAERSGIKSLPNMKNFFWSSTEKREDPIRAYMFNGVYGDISSYHKENGGARVRCVAQTY